MEDLDNLSHNSCLTTDFSKLLLFCIVFWYSRNS